MSKNHTTDQDKQRLSDFIAGKPSMQITEDLAEWVTKDFNTDLVDFSSKDDVTAAALDQCQHLGFIDVDGDGDVSNLNNTVGVTREGLIFLSIAVPHLFHIILTTMGVDVPDGNTTTAGLLSISLLGLVCSRRLFKKSI